MIIWAFTVPVLTYQLMKWSDVCRLSRPHTMTDHTVLFRIAGIFVRKERTTPFYEKPLLRNQHRKSNCTLVNRVIHDEYSADVLESHFIFKTFSSGRSVRTFCLDNPSEHLVLYIFVLCLLVLYTLVSHNRVSHIPTQHIHETAMSRVLRAIKDKLVVACDSPHRVRHNHVHGSAPRQSSTILYS